MSPRLPDETLEQVRSTSTSLYGVDAHAGHDDALGADHDLVADRDAVVETRVRPDVAGAAEDRTLDERAASMCEDASITDRAVRALRSVTLAPSTEYSPTVASGATRQ